MKVIVRPRAMGKTTALLKFAHEEEALIICHKYSEAQRLWKIIRKNGWEEDEYGCGGIPEPVSWESMPCSIKSKSYRAIVIDNVDLVLNGLLHQHGLMTTMRRGSREFPRFAGMTMSGIPEVDYDEMKDMDQWEDFRKHKPDMTYQEFVNIKYKIGEYDE